MQGSLLTEIIIVLGLAVAVLFVFLRIRMPTILGFLLTGIIAGPGGLGLISAPQDVEMLAEFGVILLLFTIGIEFSLKNLLQIKRSVLLGGAIQVFLTIGIVFGVCKSFGLSYGNSFFIGFLVTLSSTAIVLKLLQERAEIDSAYGRITLAVLIFQDIVVVPMMICIPFLTGASGVVQVPPHLLLIKGSALIVFTFLCYKWLVPKLLYYVAKTRSRELFLLSIVFICFSIAGITYFLGLSLALGAFLAGLIISESEYSHEALGRILPFRDLFVSFFFISIGMLLDISFFLQYPGVILLIALGVILLKILTGSVASMLLGYPPRIMILAGFALSQIGEFSFVLSKVGTEYGLLTSTTYQIFLEVTLITMAMTPFMITLAPKVADIMAAHHVLPGLKRGLFRLQEELSPKKHLKDHLIIIGFGVNGKNIAEAAKESEIPNIIIELNPDTVHKEQAMGRPIYYGDATQEAILEVCDIHDARIVVITVPDVSSVRKITALARKLNPNVYLIVRTRYVQEVNPLYQLGANEVVPEEFETSIEIFSRVLTKYLKPSEDIQRLTSKLRSCGYQMLRSPSIESAAVCDLAINLPDFRILTVRLYAHSPFAGKKIEDIQMRKKYHVSIMAIRRGTDLILNPGAEDILLNDDELVLAGQTHFIDQLLPFLH
ncbi:MAG: cation:proton antiporter [Deltaproteobacteria bacterium]|nr:cation:proton antiporter [Deltaproteobacteria bacterium]